MRTLLQDLRFGLRVLWKSKGFTVAAVVALALGVAANTAIFSVVHAVLIEPLPYKDPGRLVMAWELTRMPDRRPNVVNPGNFLDWREQADVFEELAGYFDQKQGLTGEGGEPQEVTVQQATPNLFRVLGVEPIKGRGLSDEDARPDAPPVVVMGHGLWQRRFGGDPGIVGKTVTLGGTPATVVGVMPAGFQWFIRKGSLTATPAELWAPLAFAPNAQSPQRRGRFMGAVGRLKPGVTLEAAQAQMDGIGARLAEQYPYNAGRGVTLVPLRDQLAGVLRPALWLLVGAVGFLLLIACANVANLLLARAALRGSEITIRLAVGAGRWRLMRQLLTESLLLSVLGGALGILFALWGKDALAAMGTGHGDFLPANIEYSLNLRVLGFTIVISVLTGLLFGLAPAWRATSLDLSTALKESNRSAGSMSRSRVSKALVILQVALSLVLLVGAGLFIRTVRNLERVELGFNQENLLLFSVQPRANGYKDERLLQFYKQLFERLDALPQARAVTLASIPLIAHYQNNSVLILPGETAQSGVERLTNIQIVRENYFTTMEIPLLRGRYFSAQDDKRAPQVAIISETLARKYFPNDDPIGKRVGFGEKTVGKIEIVGIARDIKYASQREEDEPLIYLPWQQNSDELGQGFFAIRTTGDPTALVAAVRQSVREVDNSLPVTDVKTQAGLAGETLRPDRLFASLLSFFGLLALLLAAIGLYGVLAYSVTQRTREIGIRLALGAQRGDVLRLVIWHGLKLVLMGLFIGALAAFALTRVIASQLYGVRATDPVTFVMVGALLMIIALLACWVPARRATKVDPLIALRAE
ncbi:MAG TPA: ABC transporter permease [Pyrinomonadaceae bacterium]|nr:ABC transporter permease [Pyrinomonadaceae bacterium]